MPLDDDQKRWLEQALKGRGILASRGIKDQFKKYVVRRAKVAEVADPLPTSHSNYIPMQIALTEADTKAKAGDFKGAYGSLSAAKALAKATDAGTSGKILENELAQRVKLLENTISVHIPDVDDFFGKVDRALDGFTKLQPCSAAGSLEDGVAQLKVIVALEPNLRATMEAVNEDRRALDRRFSARKIDSQIAGLREELQRLGTGGYADIHDRYIGKVDAAEAALQSGGTKYKSSGDATSYYDAAKLEAEKTLLDRKNLERLTRQVPQTDEPTENVRSALKPLDVDALLDDIIREADRAESVRTQYLLEKEKDKGAFAKVGSVDLELTPLPPQFLAADVMGDIDVDGKLRDDDIKRNVETVGSNLKALLKSPETPQSVLLDLMSKSFDMLKADILQELFTGKKHAELSRPQQNLVLTMASEMFDKINEDAPNKVSANADAVTVGDQTFNKVRVLKAGGLGTATLFEEPTSGKKMVMKTPNNGDEQAYADLLKEMKIMNRAQEGAVGSPTASAIPEFVGAARGEDGSMHMLMEFIEGGDMSEVSATMNALGGSGLMPKAALKAMQGDLVGKAAEALGELQRQGLMHHDIKGLNIMMTKSGNVKIIDYGESTFVRPDGTARRKDVGNATPGYAGPDAFKDGGKVTVDNFALGSMLMSMVEQRQVHKWNENESDTGALGRLIQALHKAPDQRVSLEGLAESAFMTSAEADYGEDAMADLRKAANEFTQATKSLKSGKGYAEVEANLKGIKAEANGPDVFSSLIAQGKSIGLDDAQGLLDQYDALIEEVMRAMQGQDKEKNEKKWLLDNRRKLAELTKARAYVQSELIDDILDTAIRKSDEAYQTALNDPNRKITLKVAGGKKRLTLKDAVAKHEDLLKALQLKRNDTIKWLESASGDEAEIRKELDARNVELIAYDDMARLLKQEIEEAAGPAAKLHFSKERLDAACVSFGPSEGRREPEEMAADELERLLSQIGNAQVTAEVEQLAEGTPA